MNKYQKAKSREIWDIMRADVQHWVTYKEAKRKWRSGIRAFLVDDSMNAWVSAELGHLGMSRARLHELGQAYRKILMYCTERNLHVRFFHESRYDEVVLRFSGWSLAGTKYSVACRVSGAQLRQYANSLDGVVDHILERVNNQLRNYCFPPVIKPGTDLNTVYSRATLYPWDCRLVEPVLGKVIVTKTE